MGKCYDIVCDCSCAAACGGRYYSLDAEGAKHAFMQARDFCPQPKEALSNLTVLGVQELAVGSQSLSEQCAGTLKSAHAVLALIRLLELEQWHADAEAVCASHLYRDTVSHVYEELLKLQTFLEQRTATIMASEDGK